MTASPFFLIRTYVLYLMYCISNLFTYIYKSVLLKLYNKQKKEKKHILKQNC